MILWTMQPEEVYQQIMQTGVYICDPARMNMPEFTEMYNWLTGHMRTKIGPPPSGVVYPVWGWYKQNGRHYKPDLRGERWCYGAHGQQFICIELEIPDAQVLLSDFDTWNFVLCNGLISETEEENAAQEAVYESLSPEEQKKMKYLNWERVFDITPFENEWGCRGKWVQATFWVLTKEMIRKVRHFKTASTHRPEKTD